jgi:hypothetical protein
MFGNKTEAQIDGEGNVVIQNVSGSTITINPDNLEEVRNFLIDFSQKISELPLEVVALLEEKSQQMDNEIEKGANLYLTVIAEIAQIGGNGVSWGTTITNLTREIRYFNQPYFKVSPKFQLEEGLEHDTFMMMQREGTQVEFPYRLEFGQIVNCYFPVNGNAFQMYQQINQEDAFIQAFVTTTIGEIYSSRQYPISKFIADYQGVLGAK